MCSIEIPLVSAHLVMMLWALIVGWSFPVVSFLSPGLPPLMLTAVRFLIAAMVLFPVVISQRQTRPSWRALLLYLLLGSCLAAFFASLFWAAQRASALSLALLYLSVPLLSYGLGRMVKVEPRDRRVLALLWVGALGASGLVWAEQGAGGPLSWGWAELVFLGGCVCSALYPVVSKWGLSNQWLSASAVVRTFWSLLGGSVLVVVVASGWESPWALLEMTVNDLALLVYLGVFSSGATFWLLQHATAQLSPAAVTAYSYLLPFVSMLLLWSNQPHRIGWHWGPGTLLVLICVGGLVWRDTIEKR